ncbi:MAG: CaiB/BaiF CoA-transferase family protein [Pseudomonadota bacterium]|nr:CaiB/BaiF CoA-transferase family protein [Pseudomonadota bacterium]
MTGVLDGLLVVTLEQAVAAPYCSSRLADDGARVIKIERAEGDFGRRYDSFVHGESAYFVWLNRGKESLTADIKDPDDAALLHRILAKADVFIQNLAPGAAGRAGFDSGELRARHPRLITVDISGYGEDGTYAQMKAFDMLVQAESGLISITGGANEMGRVGVSVCDIGCGMYAHTAVLKALLKRGQTGQGSGIKVSLFSGMAEWMAVPLLQRDYGGYLPPRMGLHHPSIAPYGDYACAHDERIVIGVQNERQFANFCTHVLDMPALPEDPRFATNVARLDNRPALDEVIESVTATLPRNEMRARLDKAGVPYGAINSVDDLIAHPQLKRLPVGLNDGRFETVAPPAAFVDDCVELGPVPALGEHSAAIRGEFADTAAAD